MAWNLTFIQGAHESQISPPAIFGRSGDAEMRQQTGYESGDKVFSIPHKYLSRAHLRIYTVTNVENASTLKIEQLGKNPSFWGPRSTVLSQGAKIELKPTDVKPSSAENCICFPRELNLPKIIISFIDEPSKSESEITGTTTKAVTAPGPLKISIGAEEDDELELLPTFLPQTGSLLDEMTATRQEQLVDVERIPSVVAAPANPPIPSAVSQPTSEIPQVGGLTIGKGWGLETKSPNTQTEPKSEQKLDQPTKVVDLPLHASTPAEQKPIKMGFWEWKAHLDGDDHTAANWKPYKKAVADKLEEAYRNPAGQNIVQIDSTYAVCFDDKSQGMVQYRKDDPSRWRPVRRRGGDIISRQNVKRVGVIPTNDESSNDEDLDIFAAAKKNVKKRKPKQVAREADSDDDDYVDDGWIIDDDDEDDDYDDSSDSDASSLTSSSSDEEEKRRRRKKNTKKK